MRMYVLLLLTAFSLIIINYAVNYSGQEAMVLSLSPAVDKPNSVYVSDFTCDKTSVSFNLCNYAVFGNEFYIRIYGDLYNATKSFYAPGNECDNVVLKIAPINYIERIEIIPKNESCNNVFAFRVNASCV